MNQRYRICINETGVGIFFSFKHLLELHYIYCNELSIIKYYF
jgi:hypothetical protein